MWGACAPRVPAVCARRVCPPCVPAVCARRVCPPRSPCTGRSRTDAGGGARQRSPPGSRRRWSCSRRCCAGERRSSIAAGARSRSRARSARTLAAGRSPQTRCACHRATRSWCEAASATSRTRRAAWWTGDELRRRRLTIYTPKGLKSNANQCSHIL